MSRYTAESLLRSRHACLFGAAIAVTLLLRPLQSGLAGIITIYSDNFADDAVGSVPVTPVVGAPWQTSATTRGGIQVILDPLLAGNAMQLDPYHSTVVMPFSAASQSAMATNGDFSLSFDYHGVSSGTFTPYLDISGIDSGNGESVQRRGGQGVLLGNHATSFTSGGLS